MRFQFRWIAFAALSLVCTIGVGAQDDPVLPGLMLDDFEAGLPTGAAEDGAGIGFIPWGDQFENVTLAARQVLAGSAAALPAGEVAPNTVLEIRFDITGWGGFTHAFTDGTVWTSMDWTDYNALSFWIYGGNTGGTVQIDLFDNRSADVPGDTAERYFFRIQDDFTGWRQFTIPFALFERRTDWQPGGAPNDGLGLDQVSGYAFGFPAGVGAQTMLLDQVALSNVASDSVMIWTGQTAEASSSIDESEIENVWNEREWTLVWSDEFDGAAGSPIDSTKWTAEVGGHGWGNNELEYYTARTENASMDGQGSLAITAREENPGDYSCHYGECRFTSARLITLDKFEFTYGRVEARIQVPRGQGIWPAFWMLGANFGTVGWPACGEIDIMENIGREPNMVYGTIHGPGYSGAEGFGGSLRSETALADGFHVFAIDWDPDVIRWYLDGEMYHTATPNDLRGDRWVFDHEFFILLNVAVGGYWPGMPDDTTEFPQTMLVDYVRVYELAGQ